MSTGGAAAADMPPLLVALMRRILGTDARAHGRARWVLQLVRDACVTRERFGDVLVGFERRGWYGGAALLDEFERRRASLRRDTSGAIAQDDATVSSTAAADMATEVLRERDEMLTTQRPRDAEQQFTRLAAMHAVRSAAAADRRSMSNLVKSVARVLRDNLIVGFDGDDDDLVHAAVLCSWLLVQRADVAAMITRRAVDGCQCSLPPAPTAPTAAFDERATVPLCVHVCCCADSLLRAEWAVRADVFVGETAQAQPAPNASAADGNKQAAAAPTSEDRSAPPSK
jgi:hypothetical protein